MLPRRHRLSRASFPGRGAGRRAETPHFSLVAGASSAGGASAVVSKKVARRAVDRNLLKRRMLSLMRPYVDHARFLVVYARSGAAALPYPALAEELTALLSRSVRH